MAGLLSTLLLVVAQQTSPLPFDFELPEGYAAFAPSGPGAWSSMRADANASFRIHHFELGAHGAIPKAVAEDIRRRSWEPTLHGIQHEIRPWSGTIDGMEGAGWLIDYQNGQQTLTVVQRLAIQGDRMVMLVWEGPQGGQKAAEALFDGFVVPADWLAIPPPETDIYRGMGPSAAMQPFPGQLQIEIRVLGFLEHESIEITIDYTPGLAPVSDGPLTWHHPAGAVELPLEDDLGGRRTRYRLPLAEDAGLGSPYGITRVGPNSFTALDPQWLALPSTVDSVTRLMPPSWSLSVLAPANLDPLAGAIAGKEFDAATKALRTRFHPHEPGLAWPYFLIGDYELRQTSGVNWHLRLDSKATLQEDTMQEMVRLKKALDGWIPGAAEHWTMASFPWVGDRVLPGLTVLDEQRGWFSEPVDTLQEGLTRRTALARLLCQERAGIRRHGLGSASLFLDASLAEYLSWRLLKVSGNPDDAAALLASWKAAEAQAGPLPMPLSLLEIGDLYGPRRLLSFGPLVWVAIEQECGRAEFDLILKEFLGTPGWWSTEDLEKRLKQAKPEADWEVFFRKHVYGRDLPASP